MDSGQQKDSPEELAAYVAECLQIIKNRMPETYKFIQAKAAGELGKDAYALVRRSLRGEPNLFYAVEGGHVVGTIFFDSEITNDMAKQIVQFGCKHMVLWALPKKEVAHGAH